MKQSIKSTVVLVLICAVISIALAFTNYMTAPIISANESASANAALYEVMPDGGNFELVDLSTYELPATVQEAYRAENGGYVVKLNTNGYNTGMVIMAGVNPDGTVSGAVCLGSAETLGYEKTYGSSLVGATTETIDSVDTVSGATMTTSAYRNAVKDALNTAIILGGGSVDIRSEEEILRDNLSAALAAAEGEFEKYFFVEVIEGVDAVYTAVNGTGYVCVIGEQFVGVDAEGNVLGEVSEDVAAVASAAVATIKASTTTDIDISKYSDLPSQLVSAKKTASGNYIIEIKGAGYGITGGDEYHPASGEYIFILVSITKDGTIIDCKTLSQAETQGIGSPCADESFYGQFDGKTEADYLDIDVLAGATLTTNGYTKAIQRAFECVKIFEGGAN